MTNILLEVGQRTYTDLHAFWVLPETAESSDTDVCTVSLTGGVLEVVAVGLGETRITVGDKTFKVEVTDE